MITNYRHSLKRVSAVHVLRSTSNASVTATHIHAYPITTICTNALQTKLQTSKLQAKPTHKLSNISCGKYMSTMTSNVECTTITFEEGQRAHIFKPTHTTIKGGIILVTDIFGIDKNECQNNSKQIAEAGYVCIVPDCINGDPLTTELLKDSTALPKWLEKHHPTADECQNAVAAAAKYMEKEFSIKADKTFMIGICYGGKAMLQAFNSSLKDSFKGGMIVHGSFMQPSDFATINKPMLLLWAENDHAFDYGTFKTGVDELQAKLKTEGKAPLCGSHENFNLEVVKTATHGFWVNASTEASLRDGATKRVIEFANSIA